jgi:hypothetical protein
MLKEKKNLLKEKKMLKEKKKFVKGESFLVHNRLTETCFMIFETGFSKDIQN